MSKEETEERRRIRTKKGEGRKKMARNLGKSK